LYGTGEADQEKAQTAVQTVHKMLVNLATNLDDVRLRSIRISNKVFASKVAAVPGGAELLVAAGYQYRSMVPPAAATSTVTAAAAAAASVVPPGEAVEELYLTHAMDELGRRKLVYAMSRVAELLESAGGGGSPRSPVGGGGSGGGGGGDTLR
jgi:hypothetical protein